MLLIREPLPTATLSTPVVLLVKDWSPKAVLLDAIVLAPNAPLPNAALPVPVVLALNAQKPTAVLFDAVFACND